MTRKKSTVATLALLALLLLGVATWLALDSRTAPEPDDAGSDANAEDARARAARTRTPGGRAGRPAAPPSSADGRAAPGGAGSGSGDASGSGKAGGAAAGGGRGAAAGAGGGAGGEAGADADAEAANLVQAKRVSGRVVDAATGDAIAGARVLLVVFDGPYSVPSGSWGSVSGSDGAFSVGPDESSTRKTRRVEIRAVAPGHEMEATVAEEGVEVRLTRRDGDPPRGTVLGLATTPADAPLAGRIQIEMQDALGDWHGVWAVAAADGSFRLDGVPAGAYRMWIQPLTPETSRDVTVPDGTDVRVHLRGSRVETDEPRRPSRPVRLTGLPHDPGLWVRLHVSTAGSQFWRAPVVDGAAEFAAVQPGTWNVVVERGDVDDRRTAVEVPAGEGTLVVEVAPPPE